MTTDPDMQPRQINITLGTAGHIDHGKTALIRLLTGCETDRLKEERERGMSIELGFAPCTLEDIEVGIVDVPGHEHFLRTMVAGAAGVDAVILVVAADDGVMPQTREHLDVMTLLGVTHGVIALTKIDRVSPERVDEVRVELETFTRGTFLEGVPILPVSSITGEGVMEFLAALKELVANITPRSAEGVFRLPVERSFSIKGFGTVISGIPLTGSIHTGDEIALLPQGLSGRVSSIQVYGRDSDEARSGQCAALNIRHWDTKLISRGDTLTVGGAFELGKWFVARMQLLGHVRAPLKNGAQVRLHVGTSEVTTSVYLMEGNIAGAGSDVLVEFRTVEPIVAGPGDRFILRSLSPPDTIAGGMIVEGVSGRLKRNRPGVVDDLTERAQAVLDRGDFVEYALRTAPEYAVGT